MTQLTIRENWFEDLVDLRRGFDQLFNRLLTGWPAAPLGLSESGAGHVYHGDHVYADTTLPGCRLSLLSSCNH